MFKASSDTRRATHRLLSSLSSAWKEQIEPLLNFQHSARWVAATHEAVDPYSVYIQKYAQVTCQTLVWGARWRTSRVQVCFCSSSSHLSQVRLIATSRNRSSWAEIVWKLVCFRKSIWTSSLLHIEFREQLLVFIYFLFRCEGWKSTNLHSWFIKTHFNVYLKLKESLSTWKCVLHKVSHTFFKMFLSVTLTLVVIYDQVIHKSVFQGRIQFTLKKMWDRRDAGKSKSNQRTRRTYIFWCSLTFSWLVNLPLQAWRCWLLDSFSLQFESYSTLMNLVFRTICMTRVQLCTYEANTSECDCSVDPYSIMKR